MKRVVVTGMGIVSSVGNNTQEVLASLREAKSGTVRADKSIARTCSLPYSEKVDPSGQIWVRERTSTTVPTPIGRALSPT